MVCVCVFVCSIMVAAIIMKLIAIAMIGNGSLLLPLNCWSNLAKIQIVMNTENYRFEPVNAVVLPSSE